MVSTNDIRPGQSILVDGILYQIIEYQHVKPGKGKAFVKTKLKNLTNGGVLDKTFRADEDVEQAFIDKQTYQYLYNDADKYFFMNADSYEQIELTEDQLNEKELLLKPNQEVTLSMYACSTSSSALKVLSNTPPLVKFLSLVFTNALPLPGFTC